MGTRKYTRKQLKKPDEFISFSIRAWEVVQKNGPKVLITLVVSLVVIAGAWTWSYFSESKSIKATGKLSRAFDIYNQTIVPKSEKLPPPKKDDHIPRFKTRKSKLETAEKEFSTVIKAASGELESMALMMRAGVKYDKGDYKGAIKDYQTFLKQSKDEQFRFIAIENIAYCLEAQKSFEKALEQLKKLPQEGDKKWIPVYHEARILAKRGKLKEARKLFRKIIDKAESRSIVDHASSYLAYLEVK